jgi:uncharacterized protein (TIGR02265 family)
VTRIKAASVTNTIAFARQELGSQFDALVAELPPATRSLLQRQLLPVEWLPADDWMAFLDALLHKHFHGNEQAFLRLTHRTVERDFNTFYRMFLRLFVSPFSVIDRAAKLYSTYVEGGTIKVDVRSRGDASAPAEVYLRLDVETRYEVFALSAQGVMEQLLKMSGARDLAVSRTKVKIEHARLAADYAVIFRN